MSSLLPLTSNLTFPLLQNPHFFSIPFKTLSKSHICFTFSSSNKKPIEYGTQEEARWLREEQRWLREEQRWLREEKRWNDEREWLIQEINTLKLRIEELEIQKSPLVSETVASVAKLLQILKDGDSISGKNVNRISDIGSSAVPLVVEADIKDEEIIVKEVTSVRDKKEKVKKRATLRSGSEGDEVRVLQEALQKLGFYSGDEDIEFSSFSSGTEGAVKTWQATIGVKEDGIMTAELLEQLYTEQSVGFSSPGITKKQENEGTNSEKIENGTPITDILKIQQNLVTEEDFTGVSSSRPRVFLLGENRWEEPSRLSGSSKTKTGSSNPTTKCISCRGEGRILCMECDGTGEPNIEPQFMEWIGEETKCPYCVGLGYTKCDVCGGRIIAANA